MSRHKRVATNRARQEAGLATKAAAFSLLLVAAMRGNAQSIPVEPAEERWFSHVRQLTTPAMGLERAGEAYFSADAKRICFQAYPKGEKEYQIYVMNLDGSGLKMISPGKCATTCSFFSPDGSKLLFASNHLDPRPPVAPEFPVPGESRYKWDVFPGMDLFEYDFATGKTRQVTKADGYDAEGSYSPDGKHLVLSSMRDGDREIYILDADAGPVGRVSNPEGVGRVSNPEGVGRVSNPSGADRDPVGRVSNPSGADRDPVGRVSNPSGADRDPVGRVSNPSAGNPRRITNVKGYDGGPFFSPDGKRVIYRSDRDGSGNMQIFVKNVEAVLKDPAAAETPESAEKALTGNDMLYWCPFWHPSGKWLIYTRADHRGRPNYDLYLLSDDGGKNIRVTTQSQFDGLPVFSPDGKSLMWTSKRGIPDTDGAQIFIADFVGVSPAGELRVAPDGTR